VGCSMDFFERLNQDIAFFVFSTFASAHQ